MLPRRHTDPLAVGVLLLLAGCGPVVVWEGLSDDHSRKVRLFQSLAGQHVEVAGDERRPSRRYRAIAVESLRLRGERGPLVYAAFRNGHWAVVRDGVEGPFFDAIGQLVVGGPGDEIAYTAVRGDTWLVRFRGRESGPWDVIHRATFGIGADGRLSYAARRGELDWLIIDHALAGSFDRVGEVERHSDSGRIAALVERRGGCHAIRETSDGGVGGTEGAELAASCRSLQWNHTGTAVAYLGDVGGCTRLVVGRHARTECGVVAESVRFVPGTEAVAFVYRNPDETCWVVGRERHCGWEDASPPVFAEDGSFGIIAWRAGRAHVLLNGRALGDYAWAADLRRSPKGQHYAFLRGAGRSREVVHDGQAHRYDTILEQSLVLSEDGRHWACITGERASKRIFFTIDGERVREVSFLELARLIAQHPDERETLLQRWIGAGLRRTLAAAEVAPIGD